MFKKIAVGVSVLVFAVPVFTFADANTDAQLISLYTKLIELLKQELALLQAQPQTQTPTGAASLSISPNSGSAPLDVTFTLSNKTGTEALDFGDGHSTGSAGCARNAKGYCDLQDRVLHTYSYPGIYKVILYDHPTKDARVVSTATITVSNAPLTQTRTY